MYDCLAAERAAYIGRGRNCFRPQKEELHPELCVDPLLAQSQMFPFVAKRGKVHA